MKRLLTMLMPLLILAACAPALSGTDGSGPAGQDAGQDKVVLINAPLANTLWGLADDIEAAMRSNPECCGFSFQFANPVRFQETHRNMVGLDAYIQGPALARNLGAQVPVLVGSHDLVREVEDRGDYLLVRARVSLQAQVLDLEGNILTEIISQTYSGIRWHPAAEPLPGDSQDPLVTELAAGAVPATAAQLVSWLNGYLK